MPRPLSRPDVAWNETIETVPTTESSTTEKDEDVYNDEVCIQNRKQPFVMRRATSMPVRGSKAASLIAGALLERPLSFEFDPDESNDLILSPEGDEEEDDILLETAFEDFAKFSPEDFAKFSPLDIGIVGRTEIKKLSSSIGPESIRFNVASIPVLNEEAPERQKSPEPGFKQIPFRRQYSTPVSAEDKRERMSTHHQTTVTRRSSTPRRKVPIRRVRSATNQANEPVDASHFRGVSAPGPVISNQPEIVLSWTNSLTSGSSMAEDEIVQLAAELATPKVRNSRALWRLPSPTNFMSRRKSDISNLVAPLDFDDNGCEINKDGLDKMDSKEPVPLEVDIEAPPTEISIQQPENNSIYDKVAAFLARPNVQAILYLSTFAIFGSTLRMFMWRFFGGDCEFPDKVTDFLTPLSSQICVTASGRTGQNGGALFSDLPANILGSFVMGLVSPPRKDEWSPLPWLHRHHHLQQNVHLHVAIRTGFCGSLTTFASWNSQMIMMMDGTLSSTGKPQISAAIFGYIIGLQCAVASLFFGRSLSKWLQRWRNPELYRSSDDENHAASDEEDCKKRTKTTAMPRKDFRVIVYPSCNGVFPRRWTPYLIIALLSTLISLCWIADFVHEIRFYRTVWLSAMLTPFGAILRWKLSDFNKSSGYIEGLDWIPRGTLAANVLGSIISAGATGLEARISSGSLVDSMWTKSFLEACRIGLAGSLSTVSTFVGEIVMMMTAKPDQAKYLYYSVGTLLLCCLLGLSVLVPLVRLL